MEIFGNVLLLLGALILVVAAMGLFVLTDSLSRQHAATKAGSLGVVFLVLGTAFIANDGAWWWRAAAIVVILWTTMPVASHVLARVAFRQQMMSSGDASLLARSAGDDASR